MRQGKWHKASLIVKNQLRMKIIECNKLQSTTKRLVLGYVIPPLVVEVNSRNLGTAS